MVGDFYKCEEVAFSQGISSSVAMAARVHKTTGADADVRFFFFLILAQITLLVIDLDMHTIDTTSWYSPRATKKVVEFCGTGTFDPKKRNESVRATKKVQFA